MTKNTDQPAEEPAESADSATSEGDPTAAKAMHRRSFSRADKLRILEAADRCVAPGEIGELLRREGVYSSHLAAWRKKRVEGGVSSLEPKKRGPRPDSKQSPLQRVQELTRENERLRQQLDLALAPADEQKRLRNVLVGVLLLLLTIES